ncbi:conserved hypothetical protein [Arthrobacter sp. Hiyo4]|nr:conserved hypothetical protein [Arthrobacter sp. Hiyo4]
MLTRGDQETLSARIPGSVLKVYPDVAHVVLWECPERVAEDTTAFLAPSLTPASHRIAGRDCWSPASALIFGRWLNGDAAGRALVLEQPVELVITGPYANTRHPMCVRWWLIQLGAGTLAGSSWVLATLPVELLVEHRFVLGEGHAGRALPTAPR